MPHTYIHKCAIYKCIQFIYFRFEALYAHAHHTQSQLSFQLLATFKSILDAVGDENERATLIEHILPPLKKTLLTSADTIERLRAVTCLGMLAQVVCVCV